MATDVARQPEIELVDMVVTLYEELATVTAAFLGAIQQGAPDDAAQARFWAARTDLVERLRPLLAQQKLWRDQGDGRAQAEQFLAVQMEKMEGVGVLDAQVLSRLAALQAQVGDELKSLGQGKKGLVGYRVGLKGAPRFCRRTA
ncbi:MAG: hypothetical protein FP813_02985 [Desulfurivibrio sp.]|nr:hypothetical protein [Desulfurivibrio sp.]MBU4117354.1 hypothetical protein [Pseudomonadota bacterium]